MRRVVGTLAAAGLLAAALSASAAAQVTAKKTLTLDGAKRVAEAAAAEAKRLHAGGAIAVVDDGGHMLVLYRLDDTFPAASTVAMEKARTAAQFRRPTSVFEDAIQHGRTSLVAVAAMTPLEGGVPVVVDGQVVGAVGVSGAASADQDNEIAKVAAVALDQRTASASHY